MSNYRPMQDQLGGRTSRTIKRFDGVHYGLSKEKQPNEFSAACDWSPDGDKIRVRAGKKKNETTGYESHVSAIFALHLGGFDWVGSIAGGSLQAQPSEDVISGTRSFYRWDEVRQRWTWDTLDDETWNGLLTERE